MDNNTFRYYELINGYESNNIIDITRLNGKIIKSNDLRKDYYNVLPINDNYLTLSATEHISLNNVEYKLLQEKDEHIVYCNFQGDMTPIKITYCIYKNKNGTSIIEADCINLNNGERVNYSDINGI